MKKTITYLTYSGLVATSLMLATACSQPPAEISSDCKPIVAGVTTVTPGVLTAAVAEFPPYVSMKGGTLSGVDGVLLKKVAEKLCLTPKATTQSFTAVIESVKNGSADLTAGDWQFSEDRAQIFETSHPVYLEKVALMSKSGAANIDDLKGKTVGTPQGYLWVEDLQNALGADSVKLYATEDAVYQDIKAGRLDAGVTSIGGAIQAVKANNDSSLKVESLKPDERIQQTMGKQTAVVLIHKGNTKLKEAVDKVSADMQVDGSLEQALKDVGLPSELANVG
jgi:polar amino acid transport system substrate-binding protein